MLSEKIWRGFLRKKKTLKIELYFNFFFFFLIFDLNIIKCFGMLILIQIHNSLILYFPNKKLWKLFFFFIENLYKYA